MALETRALLVVKPAKLLKNLGMVRIPLEHTLVSGLSGVILEYLSVHIQQRVGNQSTYILLLLVDMTDLEPDIFFGQRARGVADNVFEALGKINHSPI